MSQRPDDVICLNAWDDQQRQAHGTDDVMNRLYLTAQLIRHGWAMSLVFAVDLIAKRLPLSVEDNGNIGIRVRFDQGANHVDDTFDRAGGLTAAVNQRRQSMKSAEKIGRPVYQNQFLRIRHRLVLLVLFNTGRDPVNQRLWQLALFVYQQSIRLHQRLTPNWWPDQRDKLRLRVHQ